MSSPVDDVLKDVGIDLNSHGDGHPRFVVKPKIAIEDVPEEMRGKPLSAEDIKRIAAATADHIRDSEQYGVRVVEKRQVVTNFENLTQDDIFNTDIHIEARPVMAGDPLKVDLIDKNYEARWVNKKSERLGYMIAIGFTYVTAKDLRTNLAVEISGDAQGHFCFHDVVLMRIPKSIYYPYLKAADNRGKLATSSVSAAKAGVAQAARFMSGAKDDVAGFGEDATMSGVGGDFAEAARAKTMEFYPVGVK